MKPNKFQVGKKINEIRERDNLTLEEFGVRLGKELGTDRVKEGIISRWENGISLPSSRRIKGIAELGNISVEELLYGSVEQYLYDLVGESLSEIEALYFRRLPKQMFDSLVEEIKRKKIPLSDKKTILTILREYSDKNKVEYAKKEIANINFMINFLSDEENFKSLEEHLSAKNENPLDPTLGFKFNTLSEYYNYIVDKQNQIDELAKIHAITHKVFKEIENLFNTSTFIIPMKTESITLQSFIDNKFQPALRRDLHHDAVRKMSNKNPIDISNTHSNTSLTLYDEDTGKVYIIPDYKDGFLPKYDFCPYLIIKDNKIYSEYLVDENFIILDDVRTNIKDCDFIAPIISILF